MKNRQGYLTIGIMFSALTVLGLRHFLDVRTGVSVSGDRWLAGW